MFKDLKWVRLTPDRPGRGGMKTAVHTFQQEPVNDVQFLSGAHVYNGAWVRDYDPALYPIPQFSDTFAFGSPQCLSIHGYVYPSLTNPAAQPSVTILEHVTDSTSFSHIWDVTAGAIRSNRPNIFHSGDPSSGPPAIFQNIAGRCFVADGAGEGLILDDRTPAIHAQKNQNLGIASPPQPLGPVGQSSLQSAALIPQNPNVTPWGTGYLHYLGVYLNHPNPNNLLGTILSTDTLSPFLIDAGMTTMYSGTPLNAMGAIVGNAVTSNTTAFTATGTISITTGTSTVTLSGATWPAGFQYAGLSINFNGYSYVILDTGDGASTIYDINGNGSVQANTVAYILGVYNGPTLANVPYTITGAQVKLTNTCNVSVVNTNSAATPPGFAFGYSQSTNSNLVQVLLQCANSAGYYRNLGNISFGPVGSGGTNHIANAAMNNNTSNLRSPGSQQWLSTDVGKTMVVDGAVSGGTMLITTIQGFINTSSLTLADQCTFGSNITGKQAFWGLNFVTVVDAVMDNNVTFGVTSASNPWFPSDVGKSIMIAGAGGAGVALFTTIVTYVGAGSITVGLKNTSGGAISGKQAVWGSGLAGVTAGPTYAYAWYDPETGAMSNISPIYQIPAPAFTSGSGVVGLYTDFSHLTPCFAVDPGSISYPEQTVDGLRFSHLVFFRTLSTSGSSTLYPIGSLTPFVGKVTPGQVSTRGSWSPNTYQGWMGIPNNYLAEPLKSPNTGPNYWYDFSSDSDLILAGGFQAPQYTNSKPYVTLRGGATQEGHPYLMANWDGRLWLVNTQEPDKLVFSCDAAQSPLGVPEECYPPTNYLRMPSVDARGIGLRTVGDMLLLTTERWAYVIAGNNESNYRLMKVSASMPGVGTYQMDEFPTYSGAEGEPTTLFYLGRDRKLYQWTVGGPVIPISGPIQNQFDAYLGATAGTPLFTYQMARVHCVSAWGRRLVIFAPNQPSPQPNSVGLLTFIYDIDNQTWNQSARHDASSGSSLNLVSGMAPMTTVYGLTIPVNEIYAIYNSTANAVDVGSWLRDDSTTANESIQLVTFPMNFDGKKTRKEIVSINIHATGGVWNCLLYVNESTAGNHQAQFGLYPDPLDSIYGQPPSPADLGAVDYVVMTAPFSTDGNAVIGYRFTIYIQKYFPDTNPAKLWAIDIAYKDWQEPGDGDP